MKSILFAARESWIEPVCKRLDSSRFRAEFGEAGAADVARFDCIVPADFRDYPALRGREGATLSNVLVPNALAVSIAQDRPRFNNFLAASGFGDLVPAVLDDGAAYPFVCRARVQRDGGSQLAVDGAGCRAFASRIAPERFFRQRYVAGRYEYDTHILAVAGKCRFAMTVELLFGRDGHVRGPDDRPDSAACVRTPFLSLFERIVEALDYSGTCCIHYKIEEGRPMILSLDPCCGETLTLDLNAYLDAYLAALAEATCAAA